MGYLVEEAPKTPPALEPVSGENPIKDMKNEAISTSKIKPLPLPPTTTTENDDHYPLGRSHLSSSRLNLSHFLWRQVLGFNIHPRVPTAGFKRIIDVATGTAIWPLDVASEYPDSAVDGYDISLKQCPPRDFLPRVRTLGEWDIFEDPPPEMCGRYDIVHVRLVIFVVRNNDPRSIIRNLMKLLKPGGWLQWDELDLSGSHLELGSSPTKSCFPSDIFDSAPTASAALKRVQGVSVNHWAANLPAILAEEGMVQADTDVYIIPPPWVKTFSDCHLMMEEEMSMAMPAEMRMEKRKEIDMIAEESRKGAVISTPLMVTVAKKPMSQS